MRTKSPKRKAPSQSDGSDLRQSLDLKKSAKLCCECVRRYYGRVVAEVSLLEVCLEQGPSLQSHLNITELQATSDTLQSPATSPLSLISGTCPAEPERWDIKSVRRYREKSSTGMGPWWAPLRSAAAQRGRIRPLRIVPA